ncbi:MAG TPA: hypothetical protein ENO21_02655, partial [Firmicutes bacterium]|nr:hypothetical protein [Bacillota bacterium]
MYECTRCGLTLTPREEPAEQQPSRTLQRRTVERYSPTFGSQSTQQYTERMMEHQYGIERKYADPIVLEKKLLFWISTGLLSVYFAYTLFDRLWGSFYLGRDLLRLSPIALAFAAGIGLVFVMLFSHALWLKWSVFIIGAAFLALAVIGGLYYGSTLPQAFFFGESYFDSERYTRMSIVFWLGLLS